MNRYFVYQWWSSGAASSVRGYALPGGALRAQEQQPVPLDPVAQNLYH